MYLADEAVIVTNPEVSSCRDSDKMVGFISSKSRRAETGETPVRQTLLVTRYGMSGRMVGMIFFWLYSSGKWKMIFTVMYSRQTIYIVELSAASAFRHTEPSGRT